MRTDALARAVGARLEGEVREATHLLAPGDAASGGIVVALDAAGVRTGLRADGAHELAALVVASDAEVEGAHPPLLRHADPRLALARIGALLNEEPTPAPNVHEAAVVAPSARIGPDVAIGPFVEVGDRAVIEEGCVLDAGAVVGPGCRVGARTRLFPRAVLYPNVILGARCRVHAGAVLGADGFGYAPGPAGAEKIHHLGRVVIGDDVEIGAGTCIDRGTLHDTTVGSGSKIDNLCQIGHNVRIGRHCLIAGQAAIGGSSRLEDGVRLGGGVAVSDHVTVGAGTRIAGRSGITKDVPPGESWGGLPAAPMREWVRERYLIHRLERIWAFVRAGEKAS